ncbi:hypothetical protein C8J56DRAFT_1062380 [Mycena floridula]|nr:hypothetical protein C8J56DRAFT_1062380 [Mycena floridula]
MSTNGSGFALKTTNLISSAMETVLDHDYAVIPMPACLALAEMFPGPEGHPNCQGRYLVLSSISQGEGRFSGIQEDEGLVAFIDLVAQAILHALSGRVCFLPLL